MKVNFRQLCVIALSFTMFIATGCKKKEDPKPAATTKKISDVRKPSGSKPATSTIKSGEAAKSTQTASPQTSPKSYGADTVFFFNIGDIYNQLSPADQADFTNLEEDDAVWVPNRIFANGTDISDQLSDADVANLAFALVLDTNGEYYIYHMEQDNWDWGFWYIDGNMDYMAFDLGSQQNESIFKVTNITDTTFRLEWKEGNNTYAIEMLEI